MFSLQIESTLKSGIGQHLPLLQHLVSLAVVESVRTLGMGYENIDLRLKWPNDIYAGAQHKVGGVVVFTSILRDILQVFSIKFEISLAGSILLNNYITGSIANALSCILLFSRFLSDVVSICPTKSLPYVSTLWLKNLE